MSDVIGKGELSGRCRVVGWEMTARIERSSWRRDACGEGVGHDASCIDDMV